MISRKTLTQKLYSVQWGKKWYKKWEKWENSVSFQTLCTSTLFGHRMDKLKLVWGHSLENFRRSVAKKRSEEIIQLLNKWIQSLLEGWFIPMRIKLPLESVATQERHRDFPNTSYSMTEVSVSISYLTDPTTKVLERSQPYGSRQTVRMLIGHGAAEWHIPEISIATVKTVSVPHKVACPCTYSILPQMKKSCSKLARGSLSPSGPQRQETLRPRVLGIQDQ